MTIRTIVHENVASRCDGCLEPIEGTPWRVNLLDTVAPERAAPWEEHAALNPGPFEFHSDPDHVRTWMRRRGLLFCRRSEVREIMRPIAVPGERPTWGLCDGLHRDAHELIPA